MITSGDNLPVHDLQQIDAYLHHLKLIGRSPKTITTYRCALRSAAAALPAGLCAEADEIIEWIAGHRSASTRATYAGALGGFYRWAIRKGRITRDPMLELDRPRRPRRLPRPVTHDQLRVILSQAREPVRLWSKVAAYAGARCVEISRLDRDDITETVTYLHGKGDKQRVVPTHPELWAAVRELPPGPVAGGRDAHAVSDRCADEYARLGLRGVTAHRLRHWFGTYALEATGGNLRAVQELLGHASVAQTQLYTAVSDTVIRSGVAGLPTFEAATADAPG